MVSIIKQSIQFIKNHKEDIILVVLAFIIGMILQVKGILFKPDNNSSGGLTTKKEIIVENMENNEKNNNKEDNKTYVSDFCKKLEGKTHEIEKMCEKEDPELCKHRSCCVLAGIGNTEKCVAGSKLGPTYHTDDNGKDINYEYYYYKNKCYGNNCE